MCTEKCRHAITPKSFCGKSLKFGSLVVGILMSIIMFVILICTAVQVYKTSKTINEQSTFASRNNYSYAVVAVLYILFMFILCLWFIWGVKKMKSSVVLSWLVIHTLWLCQTFCLLLVLIYLHSTQTDFIGWIICLLCGLVAIGILAYFLLVVFGFWTQLKNEKQAAAAATRET
ncbi:hypothetical protein NE865_01715 [Phthorimaea operculella]|nr:hypothetical protein NE865_01715 [Phthorimaea operculella]